MARSPGRGRRATDASGTPQPGHDAQGRPVTGPARTSTPRRTPGTLACAVCLALGLLAGAACTGDPDETSRNRDPARTPAITVIDGADRTVTLQAPARRVVSLLPSVTEWILAMGAADRLVARTDYDQQPALQALPSVGGGLTPSAEWLAARRPDLIVAWPDAPSRSLVARLQDMGIPVYAAPSETIQQGLQTALDLGTLLGRRDAAETAVAEVRAGLDSVRAAVAGRSRPDVLFLIGLDPLMAAGPGTFVNQLMTRAGARNVLEDLDILWPQLSLEEVVLRAPDIVLVGSIATPDPRAALRHRPGWRQVPAVRNGRVHGVNPSRVNRPGPGLDEAAALLARLIHGDLAGLPGVAP